VKFRDYYEIMGVDRNATEEEMKRSIESWPGSIIQIFKQLKIRRKRKEV